MFSNLKKKIADWALSDDEKARIAKMELKLNSAGFDDFGFQPETAKTTIALFRFFYRNYFRVKAYGTEKIPAGQVLLVANHGGQIPIDGMLVSMALLLDGNPQRLVRSMVERWVPAIPFVSTLFAQCGQLVGDEKNCRSLLERDECVLVFPEGVRGSGKLYKDRYQLQRMGTGFVRLALEAKTPIVPVGVVGCEEIYPSFGNLKGLASLLGAPYFPVTPLGPIPVPAQVSLWFGDPIYFKEDPDVPDSVAESLVERVREALNERIQHGLKMREESKRDGS